MNIMHSNESKDITKSVVLLTNNYISVPLFEEEPTDKASNGDVGTVLSNFAYYGYIPSNDIINTIANFSRAQLVQFWNSTENIFKTYYKDVLNAKKGVVYKNFPEEVLSKSEGEYWVAQILMYYGNPYKLFVEHEKERKKVDIDLTSLIVLYQETKDTMKDIFNAYINKKVSITPKEEEHLDAILKALDIKSFDISSSAFKTNGIRIAKKVFQRGGSVNAQNTTDILRFAVAICDGDISLKTPVKCFKLNRPKRRILLHMLNPIEHYEEDFAARPNTFKALMKALRPGDYSWAKNVSKMYDELYRDNVHSFASKVSSSETPIELLKSRPGIFLRQFHEMYSKDPQLAISGIEEIFPSLSVYQLLKFKKYIKNVNDSQFIIARPKSSWSKAKLINRKKVDLSIPHVEELVYHINALLSIKLNKLFPHGVMKGKYLDKIALPSNDQEVSIGRGTIYELPDSIKYIRTATYWENYSGKFGGDFSFYFDNSWNFIHKEKERDTCICWNKTSEKELAVFSGDPVISNNKHKVAAQLIDLNLENLLQEGYEFAIWSVLSYNNIDFNKAEKVFACLQFLENQQNGELFEPSKVDIQFALKGESTNKMVVLLNIKKREIVYLDMSFPRISVSSASRNSANVREFLPAALQNLKDIPTVADLTENINDGETPFLYTDKDIKVSDTAFVFKSVNPDNDYKQLDLQKILS